VIRVNDPSQRSEVLKAAVAALDKIDPNRLTMVQQPYDDTAATTSPATAT
jgi:hypothetical protein